MTVHYLRLAKGGRDGTAWATCSCGSWSVMGKRVVVEVGFDNHVKDGGR